MAKDLAEILRFGRYEPLFRIGVGGMAEVYAARIRGEAGFQKQVAVKRMLPHLTDDPKFVDMFLDEARVAANVASPYVVQTLDLGRADDNSLYIIMELIVGVTISQTLVHLTQQGELIDPCLGLELIAQAAQGLDDAHEARAPNGEELLLVHRDVSPQNILLGIDGRARMTDFGIAHAVQLRRTNTQVGEMKGKFSYFSPEQAFGKSIDRRSDVFALGVVAWELLTGRRLFKGPAIKAIDAVKHKKILRPDELRPDMSAKATQAIMTALERDADDRYATAGQFAAALKRAALDIGDIPGPRAIGRFVREVGGTHLKAVQDAIARVDAEPEKVQPSTEMLELPASATDLTGPLPTSSEETAVRGETTRSDISAGPTLPRQSTSAERPAARGVAAVQAIAEMPTVIAESPSEVRLKKDIDPEEEQTDTGPTLRDPVAHEEETVHDVAGVAEMLTEIQTSERIEIEATTREDSPFAQSTRSWIEQAPTQGRPFWRRPLVWGVAYGVALLVFAVGLVYVLTDDPKPEPADVPTAGAPVELPEARVEREAVGQETAVEEPDENLEAPAEMGSSEEQVRQRLEAELETASEAEAVEAEAVEAEAVERARLRRERERRRRLQQQQSMAETPGPAMMERTPMNSVLPPFM